MKYHSALSPPTLAIPASEVRQHECVAVVHDLIGGKDLPADYASCDVFYAEMPWKAGCEEFDRRAGKTDGRTYDDLIAGVRRALSNLVDRPGVLICGKTESRKMPPPMKAVETCLHGRPAMALVYGHISGIDFAKAPTILDSIAGQYWRVGDFVCGYGRTGRAFWDRGRRFVMSDYNPACIGYIEAWMNENLPHTERVQRRPGSHPIPVRGVPDDRGGLQWRQG